MLEAHAPNVVRAVISERFEQTIDSGGKLILTAPCICRDAHHTFTAVVDDLDFDWK